MIETIKNWCRWIFRERIKLGGGVPRSSNWSKIIKAFAEYVPKLCPFDGKTKVQLHHGKWAFHTDPSQEENPTQLYWMCEGLGTHNCHILEGHNGDFQSLNLTLEDRIIDVQTRPYWENGKWVRSSQNKIKYKMTQEDLDDWNKRFGTNWEF